MNRTALAFVSALVVAALITAVLKSTVGALRPDFLSRCYPPPAPQSGPCVGDPGVVAEGRRSWPSGHSSLSASAGVFLCLFLCAQLGVFAGAFSLLNSVFAICPVVVACWVGLTRIRDYWHHPRDVVTGLAIGTIIAFAFYYTHFPLPWDRLSVKDVRQPRERRTFSAFLAGASRSESQRLVSGGEVPAAISIPSAVSATEGSLA